MLDATLFMSEEDYLAALEEESAPLATPADACREYAANVGAMRPDQEYLLTDYDTWEKNPYYTGRKGPHPEDDAYWHMSLEEQADYIERLNAPPPPPRAPDPDEDDFPF